jgi:hypothetical protein
MNKLDQTLETQADRLAEEALCERIDTPLDEPDEYAEQCDYAGCYPWLAEVIHAHPYDSARFISSHGMDSTEVDTAFTC